MARGGGGVVRVETDAAVCARGVVKRYGDLVAVDGVDLCARRGACLGVLGPNGAGKTTLIEMLEGLKRPDAGEIVVLGRRWGEDGRAIRERMGVQLQETDFQDKLRVREVLRLFRSFYACGVEIEEVLGTIGLEEKAGALVKDLSGGQRRRLSIGCALLNEPEVLFLDEPTTGLDPQARRRVWEVVESFKAAGGAVILTTHYMEEAERLADDLMIMNRGRVIARGTPGEIIGTLGAESVVRIAVGGAEGSLLAPEDLLGLEGVGEVRREGAEYVLSARRTQVVVESLFELLRERGLALDDLRTHRPTLEDVFVSMTGRHLRDE